MSNDTMHFGPQFERQDGASMNRFWCALGLVAVAAVLRVLPHLPNFTPITAMALFGGTWFAGRLSQRALGVMLPLAALLLSDLVLGFSYDSVAVYASFALIGILGAALLADGGHRSPVRVGVASLASSILFFLVTNAAVWSNGLMYPLTFEGLLQSYVAGLPFLRNAVLGDWVYSGALFVVWALMERRFMARGPEMLSA